VKVLVPLKRVADPDNANKVKIPADGSKIDVSGLEWKPNPFDEYGLETALRLTEDGKNPKQRVGEVVVVTFGPKDTETTLRSALATGANAAIRVEAEDEQLDGIIVAKALKSLIDKGITWEGGAVAKPDLVVMGKQTVDSETNQVGQLLAEMLDWPMATFAGSVEETADGVRVGREVDGGVLHLSVKLPAVITVDDRVKNPTSVYSLKTDRGFKYHEGLRFAPLPAIMQARKKPLDVKKLSELVGDAASSVRYLRYEAPPKRSAGVKVADVDELIQKLKNEAKVL
jgi:electron transfer flavoprotein beta subunit